MTAAVGLDDVEVAMLRLAGEFWRSGTAKEAAIVDRFGIPPVRFYQRVARLIDSPAAAAAEPQIVNRLRRIRDARRVRIGRLPASSRSLR